MKQFQIVIQGQNFEVQTNNSFEFTGKLEGFDRSELEKLELLDDKITVHGGRKFLGKSVLLETGEPHSLWFKGPLYVDKSDRQAAAKYAADHAGNGGVRKTQDIGELKKSLEEKKQILENLEAILKVKNLPNKSFVEALKLQAEGEVQLLEAQIQRAQEHEKGLLDKTVQMLMILGYSEEEARALCARK